MKMRRGWLVACGALLLAVAATAADTNEAQTLKTYPLDPNNEAILATVRALVGKEGVVTPDRANSRVLVITTAARHTQIKAAVPNLAFVARNVQVTVRFLQAGRQQQRGVSAGGRGTYMEPNPLHKGSLRLHVSAVDNTITTTGDTTQLLTVSSGRAAALFVGKEVPYLDYLMDYLVGQRVLTERIAWERVGAQLVVQPTIIGDGPNINIRLYPQLSGTVGGKPFTKQFIELATEVEVADGRTLQIGGLGQHAEFYNRFLVGMQQDGTTQSLNISLTPHIMPVVGPR
ncbi:MAG: hypothetical protein NTY53_10445 [Kiritimatiellaeota bacterium]|nr:hypothetical protein [Kiritimatiellota bacterium]